MAFTSLFIASVYAINENAIGTNNGKSFGFPVNGVLARPLDRAVSYNGVAMNSIIQVLPTGLTVGGAQYYTDRTVAQVVALANA